MTPPRYFNRDVKCVRDFFERRFNFVSAHAPTLADVVRSGTLDHDVEASGFNHDMRTAFDRELGTHLADEAHGEHSGDEGEGAGESEGEEESDGEDESRRLEREAVAAEVAAAHEEGTEAEGEAHVAADETAALDTSEASAAPPKDASVPVAATSADSAAAPTTTSAATDDATTTPSTAAAAGDASEDEGGDEGLEQLRNMNREQLAFRDRALAPATVEESARGGRTRTTSTTSTGSRLCRGTIDPSAVRQRVAAQMGRKGRASAGQSKAGRNRNKDTGKRERQEAAALSNASW